MKLFSRYTKVNITATILTFIVGGVAFYFVLNYILVRQLDRSLRVEEQEIVNYVKKNNRLPEIQNTRHQWIDIATTDRPIEHPRPFSINGFNSQERENETIRRYVFSISAGGILYRVSVNQSKTETEDLLELIIPITILMIGLILLSNYLINRNLVNILWRPFYRSIDSIRNYQLSGREPLRLPVEKIDEINLLNETINGMSERIHQDYLSLKSFTENASHEMQTPLAVIRSKTESSLSLAEGNRTLLHALLSIEDATIKLSRLNQSLLLLTRIGNRQFTSNETVDLSAILHLKLSEMDELFTAKSIKIRKSIIPVAIAFHPHLAEILISNLLTNMLRYTPEGGTAEVVLTPDGLIFSNSAFNSALDSNRVFQRFFKGDQTSETTGLGLAIVYEICTLCGFTIKYRFESGRHFFAIRFFA